MVYLMVKTEKDKIYVHDSNFDCRHVFSKTLILFLNLVGQLPGMAKHLYHEVIFRGSSALQYPVVHRTAETKSEKS